MPKREEFVSHMAQRGRENDAASRGVPINQKKGGVCWTHGTRLK
jgi:hypothetical protein